MYTKARHLVPTWRENANTGAGPRSEAGAARSHFDSFFPSYARAPPEAPVAKDLGALADEARTLSTSALRCPRLCFMMWSGESEQVAGRSADARARAPPGRRAGNARSVTNRLAARIAPARSRGDKAGLPDLLSRAGRGHNANNPARGGHGPRAAPAQRRRGVRLLPKGRRTWHETEGAIIAQKQGNATCRPEHPGTRKCTQENLAHRGSGRRSPTR